MTPLAEQAISRAIEVCFESLPQAFIQTVFILRAPSEATTLQLASLVSSLVAVGFVMANLEYVSLLHYVSFPIKTCKGACVLAVFSRLTRLARWCVDRQL